MANDERERRLAWERDGFFVVQRALREDRVRELSKACDFVLEDVRAGSSSQGHSSTHVSLFAPESLAKRPETGALLTEFASSREVLTWIAGLGRDGEGLLNLRDTQYFHEPSTRDYDGAWHRDGAGPGPNDANSTATRPTLLRFRVAFAHDDHLEYVPGSHVRPDTPEEARVLKGAARNAALASPAVRIALEPGDICVFHTWGIHRARYRSDRTRRTLDLVFGFGPRKPIDYGALRELATRR